MYFSSGLRKRLQTDDLTSPHTAMLESLDEQPSLRCLLNQDTSLLVLLTFQECHSDETQSALCPVKFRIGHICVGPICGNIILMSWYTVGILKTVESASLTFPLPNTKIRKNVLQDHVWSLF